MRESQLHSVHRYFLTCHSIAWKNEGGRVLLDHFYSDLERFLNARSMEVVHILPISHLLANNKDCAVP